MVSRTWPCGRRTDSGGWLGFFLLTVIYWVMGTTPERIQAHKAWLSAFSDFFTRRTPEWFPNAPHTYPSHLHCNLLTKCIHAVGLFTCFGKIVCLLLEYRGRLKGGKAARAWNWPLVSNCWQVQECVKVHHSHTCRVRVCIRRRVMRVVTNARSVH